MNAIKHIQKEVKQKA